MASTRSTWMRHCRAFIGSLHTFVQDYHAQIALRLTISIDGAVQAENLGVELRITGGSLREKFLVDTLLGRPK